MKIFYCITAFCLFNIAAIPVYAEHHNAELIHNIAKSSSSLEKLIANKWFSGAENCEVVNQGPIEVFAYDQDTYVLRQNKCLHYEAPFIYLLIGKQKALLIDTGATTPQRLFPLAETVKQIIEQRMTKQGVIKQGKGQSIPELIVVHSHSHSDHIAADNQFNDVEGVTLVAPNDLTAITSLFGINQWPEQDGEVDLGNRVIKIIGSPGHQKEAISLYDGKTQFLFTGDTFYPGRLYIKDWNQYKQTIERLIDLSSEHTISAILGAHIEMSSKAKQDYPIGQTYQPSEDSLVLTVKDLQLLNSTLKTQGAKPQRIYLDKFIVYPVD